MPWKPVDIDAEIERRRQTDPEFRKAWDESREEYRLIGEFNALRKKEGLTQKELAELAGCKQQVLSRIECRESVPTIRAFSNLLNAMGYQLTIQKKS